jgi:hypothetical protein
VIDFEALNPPLLSLLGRLAVGANFTVEHAGRSRKIVSPVHKRSVSVEQLGITGGDQDEERREKIPDDATGADAKWAGKARSTVVGDRVVTYQIGCDALENTDAGWAWTTIERLRTRLRRQSTIAELEELDASLNHIGDESCPFRARPERSRRGHRSRADRPHRARPVDRQGEGRERDPAPEPATHHERNNSAAADAVARQPRGPRTAPRASARPTGDACLTPTTSSICKSP